VHFGSTVVLVDNLHALTLYVVAHTYSVSVLLLRLLRCVALPAGEHWSYQYDAIMHDAK